MWTAALASMCVGNFAALLQTNIKRMLAYSSIAHAGYVLVALTARSETGIAAAMFYLAGYAFMNVGAFAAVSVLTGKGERYQNIDDFKGLARKQPMTAAMFTIFLLSLIGVPLTGGFFGKFYIFKAALDSHLIWLSVLGLLNSAVGAYYYLRILVVMYMHEPGEAVEAAEPLSPGLRIALDSARDRHPAARHLPQLGPRVRRQILRDDQVGDAYFVGAFVISSRTFAWSASAPVLSPAARRAELRFVYAFAYSGFSLIAWSKSASDSLNFFSRKYA